MPAGRPRKQVDEQQIESLAGIGCTVAEIAAATGVYKKKAMDTVTGQFTSHPKERELVHLEIRFRTRNGIRTSYTDRIIAMQLEGGKPVPIRFRKANREVLDPGFAQGTSVMHTVDVKWVPEKRSRSSEVR